MKGKKYWQDLWSNTGIKYINNLVKLQTHNKIHGIPQIYFRLTKYNINLKTTRIEKHGLLTGSYPEFRGCNIVEGSWEAHSPQWVQGKGLIIEHGPIGANPPDSRKVLGLQPLILISYSIYTLQILTPLSYMISCLFGICWITNTNTMYNHFRRLFVNIV